MPYNKNMNKTNTKTEYQVVRNFFTDAQWDLIDAALNEYQDHFDTDEDSAILDSVGEKLQNVFDNSVDQSNLMDEGNSEIKHYCSPIDDCCFEYKIVDGNLSYKIQDCNWQDFILEDKRAYTDEEYAEFLSLLEDN